MMVWHAVEEIADLGDSGDERVTGVDDADVEVGWGRRGFAVVRCGFPDVEGDCEGWFGAMSIDGWVWRWCWLCCLVGRSGLVEGNQIQGAEDVVVVSVQAWSEQRPESRAGGFAGRVDDPGEKTVD